MKLENLKDLLHEQLQDMYDAEHQLLEALPKMQEAATSPDLKKAFGTHLTETRQHVTRLERVFKAVGEKPERKTCKAMKGLIQEGQEMIKQNAAPEVMDAGLIAAAQRVEHYEIAGYGTLAAYAKHVIDENAVLVLIQTLHEERNTDSLLSHLAEDQINIQAVG